jgi:mannose-6-phosphate isomerase-like protein (cupin superfamily)
VGPENRPRSGGSRRSDRRHALTPSVSGPPDAIAPDGSEIYYRVLGASRASLVEVVLRPGGVTRPVRHRTVEEIWYFIAGTGQIWLDDEVRDVQVGSTVVVAPERDFQFRTTGVEALRFLCYTSPPWPGDDEAVRVEAGGLGPPNV